MSATTLVIEDWPVSKIVVGKRHRKDLGDIAGLARSIRDRGLLQPIVVRADGRLIAGARRLAAVKALGWETVPVHVISGVDDALQALLAEGDENTCRKDFTPLEAVSLGADLERLLKQEARKRQQEGRKKGGKTAGRGRPKQDGANLAPTNGTADKTRDKVAEAVGMGHTSYQKAKAVAEAAAAEPEKYRDLAERMDRTRRVDGVYRELQRRQAVESLRAQYGDDLPPELADQPARVDRLAREADRLLRLADGLDVDVDVGALGEARGVEGVERLAQVFRDLARQLTALADRLTGRAT
jgi:ParB family chromosome partitioning protein